MGAKTLVEPDISAGRTVLVRLDESPLKPDAAFWLLGSDSSWRLYLHSRLVDEGGPSAAYVQLQKALRNSKNLVPLKKITLLKQEHELLKLMRAAISTGGQGINEIRFTANTINGTFIEDAVIYRM